ncbi:hypothetical protein Q8A67_001634 [Cirrhinus molitorella]|uniref:Uncharacterized protein n=1 Tax=Cirrhinus molitorella TaxID=172907 RepID=A0AA88QG27_9TELE|nr:hypothetical protein Q8A67_001634 [Cirrhinus molitorella]
MTTNPTQPGPSTVTNIITTSGSNTQTLEVTSRDNCRRDRACFAAPPTCNPGAEGSCYFLSTRGVSGNADNYTFEISGESDGYIGAGLSRNSTGQGATVYSCASVDGGLRLIRSTLNNQILTQDNTFIPGSFRGSVIGRKIQCIFSAAGLSSMTRAATTATFVFLVTGSISNGALDSPVNRLATSESVDLSNPNSTDVSVIIPVTNGTASNTTTTSTTSPTSMNLTQTVPPNMITNTTANLNLTHLPNMTSIFPQTNSPNITTNLTQTHPPNVTSIFPPTNSPNITTNLTQTQTPNVTSIFPPTNSPNITTNLTQTQTPNTHPPNVTSIFPPTNSPNITTNLTQTHPPNVTSIFPPTNSPNITTNLTQTHPPNVTSIFPPTNSPNITTNLTQTHPPNVTSIFPPTNSPNITTNLTQTHPPNVTSIFPPTNSPNITTNLTQTHPPNVTSIFPPTNSPNITTNLTQTHPPNVTSIFPPTNSPNITTNLTQTHPPNVTSIFPPTNSPNITTNLTQTHPPNVTSIFPPTNSPNITTNLTQTHPPNVTNIFPPMNSPNITTNLTQTHPPNDITGRDNCRRDRACFSAPPTCNPGAQDSCYFLSTRGVSGNADNYTFELSGESDGYIGAGLSRDSSGQGATVYSCANVNGALRLFRSILNNQILTQDNTFIPGSFRGSLNGRKIQCIFTAAGLNSVTRAATTDPYVFLLTGSVSNGVLDSPVTRLSTNETVNLSNPNSTDVSVIIPTTNATASNTTTSTTTAASANLTQTVPPNTTANLTQTLNPNITTSWTHQPNTTTIVNQTASPNITTGWTHQPNTTTIVNQTANPNITTSWTRQPNITTIGNQTANPNITTGWTHQPNTTTIVNQTANPNITTSWTRQPNITTIGNQTTNPNITTSWTRQPNITTIGNQTANPNITTSWTRQPNITTIGNQTANPNITTSWTRQPNITTIGNQTANPNITTSWTRQPNITTIGNQTANPNITSSWTRPPNITTISNQTANPNITSSWTRPPNITTNLTTARPVNPTSITTPPGSNTVVTIIPDITGRDNCRRDRACFSAPQACNPGAQDSCYFLSTRGVSGDTNNFTFELSGETDGYIGAGLSQDSTGQGAVVYSCANVNGALKFFRSTLNNKILTQDNMFSPGSFRGSLNGRKIQCIFTAAGLNSLTRAATTDPYVFFLTGSVSNGTLDSPVTRLSTNETVNLSNPNSTDVSVIIPTTNATASNTTTSTTTAASANLTQTTQPLNPNITTNLTTTRPVNPTSIITPPGSNTVVTIIPDITGRDNCRRDRACFSAPQACNPGAQDSCYFLSTRGVSGDANNFTFELSGETDGYIGAGLSRDSTGQGATVYSCANVNGALKFFRSTLNNKIMTQDNTFSPGSFRGSVNGKKIQCIFTAAGLNSNTRASTTDPYVFFLTGSVSNGTLDSPVTRLSTNETVNLSNPNSTDVSVIIPTTNTTSSNATASSNTTASSNATASSNTTASSNATASSNTTASSNATASSNTTASSNATASTISNNTVVTKDNCRKDRACFFTPASCDPSSSSSCFFASTRGVNGNSDNLTFELSGDANGYIAVGLSRDNKEGDGDTIYSCVNDNGTAKFIRATLNNTVLTPDKTFNPGSFRGTVKGTRIQCIFVAAGLSTSTRAANTSAFLFFFTGNYTNGTLGSPVTQMFTSSSVDLTNTNSSDVAIITPTTRSNALHHAAYQAALVILSGILAVLLL